ncbi:helix-turn-helix domain-containing protein [Streptosporangium canum]|uniref:PucR family transcriptional regulator n=1 Tax=Streptosporangium canum TaxID=324952 RepID=UPI00343DE435
MLTHVSTLPSKGLSRVLNDFGPTLLNLVYGDAELAEEIDGVVIHDPQDEPHYPEHAIVLGIAVYGPAETAQLLRNLAAHRAAALVVRAPVEDDAELERAVAQSGVALLALTRGTSWAQLAAMLQTLLTEGDFGETDASSLGGAPSGDLFALANAIAMLVDAPITIEDRRSNVLVFSGRQEEADSSRVASILARKVPQDYPRINEFRGVFKTLHRSEGPVFMAPASLIEGEVALPRVAIAVRAGDEILGSIWAAVREPLTPERAQALQETAKLVALHMLRFRAGTDAENRLRADLVNVALEGGAGASDALDQLGVFKEPAVVMALGLPHDRDGDPAHLTAERQRLTSAFAIHLDVVQPRSAVALLGDVAYAIVPIAGEPAHGHERAVQIASNFLLRTGERTTAMIGIGSVAQEPAALAQSRNNADRALRVLFSGQIGKRVASIADVYTETLLMEMRDIAAANGHELTAPIARLVAYDAKRQAHLIETLRAWLDAFGDIITASANAFVHPNTFRYRIRRVAEVAQIDLQDPSTRFSAMLQLRLMDTRLEDDFLGKA